MTMALPTKCLELLHHQDGVLACWQAAQCGLSATAVENLLRTGRWRRLYRGVHAAFTGEPSRRCVLWAAVLRCGPDAALSHHTAAELDGIRGRRTDAVHVTIPGTARVRLGVPDFGNGLPALIVHRSARITAARHPARTPPRTRTEETVLDLVDVAADFDEAFSWLCAAVAGRMVMPEHIHAAMARRAKMRWRTDVLVALGEIADGVHSLLERRYVRDVERPHRLPAPARQYRWRHRSTSTYLDCFFAEFGVRVEVDGLAWHPVESRWREIHQDNRLLGSGIITLRYSWADIVSRPCDVAAEIASALRSRGWVGTPRACSPACRAAVA